MRPLLFTLHAAESLKDSIFVGGDMEAGTIEHRRFPDSESYIRLETKVVDRAVVFLCDLDDPDKWIMPLLLAADAARTQGAHQVGLVAPYLGYMRQDQAFREGEAVSAQVFATILSRHFDWLVTLEPHLHRIAHLEEVFSIPARAAKATEPIGDWIAKHVEHPFLIGPDSESAPWIQRIAAHIDAPFSVFEKQRLGDRNVRISGTLDGLHPKMTPVVIDDIVSSGGTMAAIVERTAQDTQQPTIYVAVHALAKHLPQRITTNANFAELVSCNSVPHPSNRIDIAGSLIADVQDLVSLTYARHRL